MAVAFMEKHILERSDLQGLRVAIVHYWFVSRSGGEAVVSQLAQLFPGADLYALVADIEKMPEPLYGHKLTTSFVQKIPGSLRFHRKLLPLYPLALEQFDLRGYDLVISSESGPAKGVLTDSNTCHICYCHSPMRYVWDMYHEYSDHLPWPVRKLYALTAHYIRLWDLATASRVDHFVANSENVARRIQKHYKREAAVIYPPVEAAAAYLDPLREDYYLVVSRLVEYKRVDLAIQACNALGRRLRIIGDGPEYKRYKELARPTVEFLGYVSDRELSQHYARCRALLFPGEEDFGIVPVEANSFGRPVIAYGRGGALESLTGVWSGTEWDIQDPGAVFFQEQTAESLSQAILEFERNEDVFSPVEIRSQAMRFDVSHFRQEFMSFVASQFQAWPLKVRCRRAGYLQPPIKSRD
jgi:glycosyltransferase involved in cell wall biosynthesis